MVNIFILALNTPRPSFWSSSKLRSRVYSWSRVGYRTKSISWARSGAKSSARYWTRSGVRNEAWILSWFQSRWGYKQFLT